MNGPAQSSLNVSGACLCGAVTVSITGLKPDIDVCHCDMCQRWCGSFFGGLQGDAFEIAHDDAVTVYKSSDWAQRAFCKHCGSNLYYRFLPTGHHSFLAGMFDLPPSVTIAHQIFYDEKPGWYDLAQDSPRKTGAEIIAEAEAAGHVFD